MSGKPAARVSDPTACPLPGHGTNPIAAGSGDVFFDGLAAAHHGFDQWQTGGHGRFGWFSWQQGHGRFRDGDYR